VGRKERERLSQKPKKKKEVGVKDKGKKKMCLTSAGLPPCQEGKEKKVERGSGNFPTEIEPRPGSYGAYRVNGE